MTKTFTPFKTGHIHPSHRIVMAPLTRLRADTNNIQLPMAIIYYTQRALIPGTLLISEACTISPRAAASFPHTPGIWNELQIQRWREITDAVHACGCFMYCQIVAPGRAGFPDAAASKGFSVDAPSAIPISGMATPREMSENDIKDCIGEFAHAAQCAMEAGFDGVEIHGANGYLIDQFTQDNSNHRSDIWGGSVENRNRFGVEVARAVAGAIGAERTGYRISPWSRFQDMRMEDPVPQFTELTRALKKLKLGYLHVIEARVTNSEDIDTPEQVDFVLDVWGDHSVVLLAGGFTPDNARHYLDGVYKDRNVALVFGRYFLSTPDLVYRMQKGIAPNPYHRPSFYTPMQLEGYLDYPYSKEFLEEHGHEIVA
ncbi:alkene reductase [Aspergillus chevalieri]|uniref:NADH:flavin oxidoreductase/NADH oxidase N-terminal domain-containing protein n=1 Tax=Aspergillus chevalieri TaxID=182096 RepID=A0A7R7VT12_ASPCH|nr:uncharacterized protein ACHE_60106S [Aspergillus chevalieri]BCR90220.1 hypothetical protein ACHE_60106S [Aspergillus chevalieri]